MDVANISLSTIKNQYSCLVKYLDFMIDTDLTSNERASIDEYRKFILTSMYTYIDYPQYQFMFDCNTYTIILSRESLCYHDEDKYSTFVISEILDLNKLWYKATRNNHREIKYFKPDVDQLLRICSDEHLLKQEIDDIVSGEF
jgi:hypothetical protein